MGLGLVARLGLGWTFVGLELSLLGLGSRLVLWRSFVGRTTTTSLSWRWLGKQQHRCRTSSPTFVGSSRRPQSRLLGWRFIEPTGQHGSSLVWQRHEPSGQLRHKSSGQLGHEPSVEPRLWQQQQLPRHKQQPSRLVQRQL